MQRIKHETLQKKKRFWQTILGLSEWHIKMSFVKPKAIEGDIALLKTISNVEKVAVILINEEYYLEPEYGTVWNLDTVILHELVHVLLDEPIRRLAKKIKENTRFKELEEWICDKFAYLVYTYVKNKRKR
jgi:hypothetical protein